MENASTAELDAGKEKSFHAVFVLLKNNKMLFCF